MEGGCLLDINIILEIVKYIVFSIFLFYGTFVFYKAITPKEVRDTHRLRFKEQFETRAKSTANKIQSVSFDDKLKEAGLPFINSFRYEMIRLVIFLFIIGNYVILPMLSGQGFNIQSISIMLVVWILTEYRINFFVSIPNLITNFLITNKKRARSIELFTLYDVLKTDLSELERGQTVNVYNLLKDALPMFRHIDGTLSKFLSTSLTNPKQAEKILYDDIKTQGAKALGEIIVRIDELGRDEALAIIETESSTYANHFFKEEFRNGQKRKNRLQMLFSVNVLFNAAWLILFITNMLLLQMNNTNSIL